MSFTCLKKDLEEAVEITSRIVSNNAQLPVLRCILFDIKNNTVILRSTNLEIGIEKTIQATTEKESIVAIPAHILLSVLKTAPQQSNITVHIKENAVVIEISGSKTTIKTISVDEFPLIPSPETSTSHIIPQKVLITGIRSVLYSASTSLIKPELASVYMYYEDNTMIFVATDSFRLAEKKVLFKTDSDIPTTIMPVKNIAELVRILEIQNESDVEVFIDENQYAIKKKDLYITSRIIDGSFPDYKSILPKEKTTEVTILKQDLLQTLKKAQLFSDTFGQVTIHISPQTKKCRITSNNSEVGEVDDLLEAVIEGEELEISFNYKYLIDVFQSITTDSVILQFAGIGRPLIIVGVGDTTFTYLVMPMNK